MAELVLEIVEGKGAATQIPLAGEVELGRDPELAHVLDDEQVSRHHARITATADGAVVADLGSTNGTYVNDQPVEGSRKVGPGDRIRVGLTVLQLRTTADATVQGTAVRPMPDVTRISADLLRPATEGELAPVREDQAGAPNLVAEEREPAFIRASAVRRGLGGEEGAAPTGPMTPDEIAHLVDIRVKRQTSIAAYALLAIAGLAVAIFFGVR